MLNTGRKTGLGSDRRQALAARLDAELDRVGWSVVELAARLSISERTVRRWRCGEPTALPLRSVIAWLSRVAAAIEREGRPEGWSARPARPGD